MKGLPESLEIRQCLDQPANVMILERIDSTDLLARSIIADASEDEVEIPPTLILAGAQNRGRGRLNRLWVSPVGGFYFNYLRSGFSPLQLRVFSICTAVALCRTMEELGVDDLRLKWPNDLILADGKLGGVLCYVLRSRYSYGSAGIGLNLGPPPEFEVTNAYPAASLASRIESGPDVIRDLAVSFVQKFESALGDIPPSLDYWTSRLIHQPGERISVKLDSGEVLKAVFEGVGAEGQLVLQTEQGQRILSSAEIFPPGEKL